MQVLPILGSEGHYATPEEIDRTLAFVAGVKGVVSISPAAGEAAAEPWWTMGVYEIVFLQDTDGYPLAILFYVENGKIVRLSYRPGEWLSELNGRIGEEWLLPPLGDNSK